MLHVIERLILQQLNLFLVLFFLKCLFLAEDLHLFLALNP